jgi:hypothetical protein
MQIATTEMNGLMWEGRAARTIRAGQGVMQGDWPIKFGRVTKRSGHS